MLDTALLQQARYAFALFDRDGAHKHWTTATLTVFDFAGGNRFGILGILWQDRDRVGHYFLERPGDELTVVEQDLIVAIESLDFVGDGDVFFLFATVDHIRIYRALHFAIRGYADHVELVNLPELGRFGEGGARHAADFA